MAEAQDLHQIEYRYDQANGLLPVASSVSSAESLSALLSGVQAWLRHPHAERVAESVCYQVLRDGQAALAWRLWGLRGAERARGRSVVSRVLVGQEAVLSGPVAMALCRRGLPTDVIGPAPGEATDGGRLPVVGGDAVRAVARDLAAELDQEAAVTPGLLTLVAAALADPAVPLAISLPSGLIERPLRYGVQPPLLWGLVRIGDPLLGSAGRSWSFSTYEPPLGETDPASLPAIVFRKAQERPQGPPGKYRREFKVRPYDAAARLAGAPYSNRVGLAGWLVDEYRERGGDGLRRFIEDRVGTEGSFQMRMERAEGERGKRHTQPTHPPAATGFVSLPPPRAVGPAVRDEGERLGEPVPAEPVSAGPSLAAEQPGLADAEGLARPVTPAGPVTAVEAASTAGSASPTVPAPVTTSADAAQAASAAQPAQPAAPSAMVPSPTPELAGMTPAGISDPHPAKAGPAPSGGPITRRMQILPPLTLGGAEPRAPRSTSLDATGAASSTAGMLRVPLSQGELSQGGTAEDDVPETDPRSSIHQIEYRHHATRDLFPVASSMSVESLQGWHARIQAWVRHPHAERLSESVCYQVFSNGQAVLALRLRDQRAAERADGTRGRPLVSRVIVGPKTVLTVPVAIALCRAGLPADAIGPAPGDVPDGARLPTVPADALLAVAREQAPELDKLALGQPGLQALVAAALAEPALPLAVTLQDTYIQRPLREGVQPPLLWGLIRVTGPILGRVGRGWSFSTYELPLGETDPATLPDTVFRQAQEGQQAPPARHRKELKVRPYDGTALQPGSAYASRVELAGWLMSEYQERGATGLRKFIESCGGTDSSLQTRMGRVEEELRQKHSPLIVSAGLGGFVDLSSARASGPEASTPSGPANQAWKNEKTRQLIQQPGGPLPQLPEMYRVADRRARSDSQSASGGWDTPTMTVSVLLRKLEEAGQDRESARKYLDEIRRRDSLDDVRERHNCWNIISNTDWCERVCERFQPAELAAIFRLVAIPDMADQGWAEPIGRWSLRAPMPMIAGLLIAAAEVSDDRKVNEDTWRSVMGLLQPFLALRLVTASGITNQWDADLAWQAAKDFKPPEPKSNIWNPLNPRRRRQ